MFYEFIDIYDKMRVILAMYSRFRQCALIRGLVPE